MKTLPTLGTLALLLALAAPAAAAGDGVQKEFCSPYLDFINPSPPVVCVGVSYVAVNDACAHVDGVEPCIQFVGPVLW